MHFVKFIYCIITINSGQTELADSVQGTALSQIKTIDVVSIGNRMDLRAIKE